MNNWQLRKFLMKSVHGVEIPRKPAKKAIQKGPVRNWKYRAWIRSLPCACCGVEPAGEAAHTGDHGLNQKASDYSSIPLCTDCHTMAPHSYHRLGREEFERRHSLNILDLIRRLNRLWFHPAHRSM